MSNPYEEVKEHLTNGFQESMAPILGTKGRWGTTNHGKLHPVDRFKLTLHLDDDDETYRLFCVAIDDVNTLVYKADYLTPEETLELFKAWALGFATTIDEDI
jgi:hypothetical protein